MAGGHSLQHFTQYAMRQAQLLQAVLCEQVLNRMPHKQLRRQGHAEAGLQMMHLL